MKKRMIAVITALAITITAFTGITMPVGAEEDMDNPEFSVNVSDENGDWEQYQNPQEYTEGQKIQVGMTWEPGSIPKDQGLDFSYQLPKEFDISSSGTGVIKSEANGKELGTYEIDENNVIHFHFNQEFIDQYNQGINVTLEGFLPINPRDDEDGKEKELQLGNQIYNFSPTYDDTTLTTNKTSEQPQIDKEALENGKGQFIIYNTITVNVNEYRAEGLTIHDVLQNEGVKLPEGFDENSLKVQLSNSSGTSDIGAENYDLSVDGNSFDLTLNGTYYDGDTIKITYPTVISVDDMGNYSGTGGSLTNINEAKTKGTDPRDGSHLESNTSQSSSWFNAPSLNKSGAVDPVTGNITWTITFNPGPYGDIHEYLNDPTKLEALGISQYITEIIGDGQTVVSPDMTDGKLPLSAATVKGNNLVFTVVTHIDDYTSDTVGSFDNTAKLDVYNDVEIAKKATVGVGVKVEKEYVEDSADPNDATMEWEIKVYIPETFDEFTISDTTSKGTLSNGDSHIDHQFIQWLSMNGLTITQDEGLTINGGSLTMTYEYAQTHGLLDTTAKFKVKTQVVKKSEDWQSESPYTDAFKGAYDWVNQAVYTLTFNGVPTSSDPAEGHYYNNPEKLLEKTQGYRVKEKQTINGQNYDVETGDFAWNVKVIDGVFAYYHDGKWTGTLFENDTFSIKLVDTLPDNMKYKEGSAGIYPSENFVGDSDWNSLSADQKKIVKEAFDKGHLKVEVSSDEKTVTFTWTADEAFVKELRNYIETGSVEKYGNSLFSSLFNSDSQNYLTLNYMTEIADPVQYLKDMDALTSGQQLVFTNTVAGEVNGEPALPVSAQADVNKSQVLVKDTTADGAKEDEIKKFFGSQDVDNGRTLHVPYIVDINPDALSMGLENSRLILEDIMGTSFKLVEESVRIVDAVTGEVISQSDYTIDQETITEDEDKGRTRITFTMPDGRHLKLYYLAEITDRPAEYALEGGHYTPQYGPLEDGSNRIEMKLVGYEYNASSTQHSIVVKPSARGFYNNYLQVRKYDSSIGVEHALDGAKYKLEVVKYENGDFVLTGDTYSGTPMQTKGVTVFGVNNPEEEIYRLTETNAPDDYQIDETPHYIIFSSNKYKTVLEKLKDENGDPLVTVVGNGTDSVGPTFELGNVPKGTEEPGPITHAVPELTKELTGRALAAGEFSFTISAAEGTPTGYELPEDTANDENGKVQFDRITFTQKGIYTFIITEVNDKKDNITYDDHTVTLTYVVTPDASGKLTVGKPTVKEGDSTTFTNILTSSLKISKAVEVNGKGTAPSGDDFTFTVTFTDVPAGSKYNYTIANANGEQQGVAQQIASGGTITLKAGQTATITGIPVGTEYTVTETEIPENYAVQNNKSLTGKIIESGATAAFTNIYTQPKGSLEISKKVEGDGAVLTKSFDFSVELKYPNGTKETKYFTLTNGKNKTFENLPVGTEYTVTENFSEDHWTTTVKIGSANPEEKTVASGTIDTNGQEITVEFVNKYTKPEEPKPEVGSLEISKTVQGEGADLTKLFSFSVTFDYPDGKSKTETFSLANGESELFKDIPVGTKYTVTETDYTAYGYTSTSTGANGEITANETKTAAFVNTYKEPEQPEPEVGSLKISKTVRGDGADLTKLFSFSVTFDYPDGTDKTEKFSLANGESELFKDLPVGTKYTVTENFSEVHWTTTVKIGSANLEEKTVASGTIDTNGQEITVEFVNKYTKPEEPKPEVGSLKISKTVQGEGADLTKLFSFSVTFDYPDDTGREDNTETFSLANGGSQTFENLPVGTKYTVTENFSEVHWTTTVTDNNASGTISKDGQEITVEFVNKYTQPTKYFDITVSKEVTGDGADKNDEFTFTVTFTDSDKNALGGEFKIILADGTESTVKSGGTFTLKDGESVTIKGIPEGTIYTVEETGSKGYTVSFTDASGVLEKNAEVKFTNNKEKQVEQSSEPSTEAPPTTQPTQPAQTAPAPTETTTEQTAPAPVETTTEDDRNRVDGDSDSEDRQPNTANTADFGILLLVMAASCVFAAAAKKKAD